MIKLHKRDLVILLMFSCAIIIHHITFLTDSASLLRVPLFEMREKGGVGLKSEQIKHFFLHVYAVFKTSVIIKKTLFSKRFDRSLKKGDGEPNLWQAR